MPRKITPRGPLVQAGQGAPARTLRREQSKTNKSRRKSPTASLPAQPGAVLLDVNAGCDLGLCRTMRARQDRTSGIRPPPRAPPAPSLLLLPAGQRQHFGAFSAWLGKTHSISRDPSHPPRIIASSPAGRSWERGRWRCHRAPFWAPFLSKASADGMRAGDGDCLPWQRLKGENQLRKQQRGKK